MKKFLVCISLLINLICSFADASDNPLDANKNQSYSSINSSINTNLYLSTQITESSFEKLPLEQKQALSEMWNLSMTEYQHYLWLMQHTINGFYYKNANLDPSWILGMNADTNKEREKYATIAIKNERARVQKELAFQREFTRLSHLLFPNETPIAWNPASSSIVP